VNDLPEGFNIFLTPFLNLLHCPLAEQLPFHLTTQILFLLSHCGESHKKQEEFLYYPLRGEKGKI
jgi:hypothetical protein